MRHKRVTLGAVITAIILLFSVAGLGFAQGNSPGSSAPAGPMSIEAVLGTSFTYQGRLMDNGRPANGTYDFRFRLYDARTGGHQIGRIVYQNNVPVRNGLFTVTLDFGSGAFQGDGRWLQVEVRPGNSSGSYTVLTPRQPIRAVPYAMGLRPGTIVSSSNADVFISYSHKPHPNLPFYNTYGLYAKAKSRGVGTSSYGVYGVTEDSKGYGGYFRNEASGGAALYARSGSDSAPDLILGSNSSSDDNGVIASDPRYNSSDIVLRTNDTLRIDLDADKSGEDADFEIRDKNGNLLFDVDDSGAIQSSAYTYLFVPAGEAVPHADSRDLEFEYYGRGTVVIRKPSAGSGVRSVVIPISLPAVLYGQSVKINSLRVYYRTTNAATYITETDLYRQKLDGGYYTLIGDTHNHRATVFANYTIRCSSSSCRLNAEEGFVSAVIKIYFANDSHAVILGGVRVALAHK